MWGRGMGGGPGSCTGLPPERSLEREGRGPVFRRLRVTSAAAAPRFGNLEGETEARRERRAQGPGSLRTPQVEVAAGSSTLRTRPLLGRVSLSRLTPAPPPGPGWAAERGSARL